MKTTWAVPAAILFTAALGLTSGTAMADTWPSKTITIMVPFPAGGTTDLISRPIAQKLSESLKVPVIIDNRGGAGGTLGAGLAARAAPDGYTLFVGAVHHAIATSLYKKLPYSFEKDFAPITVLAYVPHIVVAHPSVPAKTIPELIALAKTKAVSYGSAGSGTSHHMAGELFKSMANVPMQHVPYKGGGPMMNDLMGGQIDLAFETAASATQQLKAGKIKPLAITSTKRSPAIPNVPTVAETVPGYEVLTWYGLLAPAGTPKEIVARLNTEIVKILQTPHIKARIADISSEPGGNSPEQFADLIKKETVKWAKVVKGSGATVD
jgi:tripartite-type tricarboxylate transporter receptor subunit TctC